MSNQIGSLATTWHHISAELSHCGFEDYSLWDANAIAAWATAEIRRSGLTQAVRVNLEQFDDACLSITGVAGGLFVSFFVSPAQGYALVDILVSNSTALHLAREFLGVIVTRFRPSVIIDREAHRVVNGPIR